LLSSPWDFDRLALNLYHEHCTWVPNGKKKAENDRPELETSKRELFDAVSREFELLRSEFEPESLVPLDYALKAVKKHGKGLIKQNEEILNNEPPYRPEISRELSRITKFVDKLGPSCAERILEVIQGICSTLDLQLDNPTTASSKPDARSTASNEILWS